jgi:tRNA(Ile)-lysidine synthase TilS/MesJ
MAECITCLMTSDIVNISGNECEFCILHKEISTKYNDFDLILNKIKNQPGKYNCITGISGGLDSSTLLYAAIKKWNLKPLVIHFNNHWNTSLATNNMMNLIKKLNVDFIEYYVNKEEYDNLNKAFLMAGVPDCDIPNDIAMTKLMYETAQKYGIKYILNGHCYKTEGSTPIKWTYMDAKYIQSIYYKFNKKKLENYPLFSFSDQYNYSKLGIEQIRPFYYNDINRFELDEEMKKYIDWKSYGWKHGENIYTDFIGSYLLPRKFGIDKRIVYLSAKIRTNLITKEEATNILNCESCFDTDQIGDDYLNLIDSPITNRENYECYNFKEASLLIYYLYLLGTIPYTFYIKYSKKIEGMDYTSINEVPTKILNDIKTNLLNSMYTDNEIETVRKLLCSNF